MPKRGAIAQFEATVVLVVISLALASVAYSGLKEGSQLDPAPAFVSYATVLAGAPPIERLEVNSSSPTTVTSVTVASATSAQGILQLGPGGYSTSDSLCSGGATTFFSVFASAPGTLTVSTNGESWISGTWTRSSQVSPGWQVVMIEGGTSCSVTLPGGYSAPAGWNRSSGVVSSVPIEGARAGTGFLLYLPKAGGSDGVLLTFTGGIYSAPP